MMVTFQKIWSSKFRELREGSPRDEEDLRRGFAHSARFRRLVDDHDFRRLRPLIEQKAPGGERSGQIQSEFIHSTSRERNESRQPGIKWQFRSDFTVEIPLAEPIAIFDDVEHVCPGPFLVLIEQIGWSSQAQSTLPIQLFEFDRRARAARISCTVCATIAG